MVLFLINKSFPTAKTLIEEIVDRDILAEITGGKLDKKYALTEDIGVFVK